jgi:hypothetical protein
MKGEDIRILVSFVVIGILLISALVFVLTRALVSARDSLLNSM